MDAGTPSGFLTRRPELNNKQKGNSQIETCLAKKIGEKRRIKPSNRKTFAKQLQARSVSGRKMCVMQTEVATTHHPPGPASGRRGAHRPPAPLPNPEKGATARARRKLLTLSVSIAFRGKGAGWVGGGEATT